MKKQEGFSAAELLITLFIGAIFLIAGSQLYITVVGQGDDGNKRTLASTASLAYLNRTIQNVELYPTNCASLPATSTVFWPYGPTEYLTYTFTFSCPDSTNFPSLRKLSIKGTNEGISSTHATYYIEP